MLTSDFTIYFITAGGIMTITYITISVLMIYLLFI
jgi:hypothetical protein